MAKSKLCGLHACLLTNQKLVTKFGDRQKRDTVSHVYFLQSSTSSKALFDRDNVDKSESELFDSSGTQQQHSDSLRRGRGSFSYKVA